jgi:RNA-directed DNA polymerase
MRMILCATVPLCHCASEREAITLRSTLEDRFSSCGLQLHPDKTKVVYCRGGYRQQKYAMVAFDFLGYTFRPRWIQTRKGTQGLYFLADVSQKSAKRIRNEINSWPWKYWIQKELGEIRQYSRSRLSGWLNYYGLFSKSYIRELLYHFDKRLARWAKKKYKKLKTLSQAIKRVKYTRKRNPLGFPHWQLT